jgi:dihydrolipoamide dehydrogenase
MRLERGAIAVDERCRATAGIWAIGDVTGVAPFTHVAGYQGRVVADAILGRPGRVDYHAVPRVVFSDPEVATVGMTLAQAHDAGVDAEQVTLDLLETDRTETYGRGLFGGAAITVDRERGTIVGAWAVGPEAGEWIHVAALAVKAQVPLGVLADFAPQFPTFSELWGLAARRAVAGA